MKKRWILWMLICVVVLTVTGCQSKEDKALEELLDDYRAIDFSEDLEEQFVDLKDYIEELEDADRASEELEEDKDRRIKKSEELLAYAGDLIEFQSAFESPENGEKLVALMSTVPDKKIGRYFDEIYLESGVDLESYMNDYFLYQHKKYMNDCMNGVSAYAVEYFTGDYILSFDDYIGAAFDYFDELSVLKEMMDGCAQNAIDLVASEYSALQADFETFNLEPMTSTSGEISGYSYFESFEKPSMRVYLTGPSESLIDAWITTLTTDKSSMYNDYYLSASLDDDAVNVVTHDTFLVADDYAKIIVRNGSDEMDITEMNKNVAIVDLSYSSCTLTFYKYTEMTKEDADMFLGLLTEPGTTIEVTSTQGDVYTVPETFLSNEALQKILVFLRKANEIMR